MRIGDSVTPKHLKKNQNESKNWKRLAGLKVGKPYSVYDFPFAPDNSAIQLEYGGYIFKSDDFDILTQPAIHLIDKLKLLAEELTGVDREKLLQIIEEQ